MRNQFSLKPKELAFMYRKPYPEAYDQIPLPYHYRVPNFTKFFGQDAISTVEHISRFLIQCGDAAGIDALKVQLFPLSLFGSAFAWFSSLPPNSILIWANLEKQFHKYFFLGVHEMKPTDLTEVRQRIDEPVSNYI